VSKQWLDGATRTPGFNAGYTNGKTLMQFVVEHFTVGRNSHGIGLDGYFNMLIPKVGPPFQYAEWDAYTFHAGPWNRYGPGIEFERLGWDEPLTEDQLFWGGCAAVQLHEDWGIPLDHYQGPRFGAANYQGFVDHGDLDPMRSDGVSHADWLTMIRNNHTENPNKDVIEMLYKTKDGQFWLPCAGGFQPISDGWAYVHLINGAHLIENIELGNMIQLGLDSARVLQKALAIKFP
jgi:hypothetical protein